MKNLSKITDIENLRQIAEKKCHECFMIMWIAVLGRKRLI